MTDSSPSPTLIFLHIQKTAGISLSLILRSYYPAHRRYSIYPIKQYATGTLAQLETMPDKEKAQIDLLMGHLSYGVHRLLPRPAQYFTVLRDPIERVLSHYYHEWRDPTNLLHTSVRSGMGIKEYVHHYAEAGQMDNLQTRMLAGNWHERGFGPCTPAMLAQAKENLHHKITVVGLTERFDETYVLLKRRFQWPRYIYVDRFNSTQKRPHRNNLSADIIQFIHQYNQYDLELYQFAAQLFEQQLYQEGAALEQEVKQFQQRYQRYYPLIQLYWQARKISLRTKLSEWLFRRQN